LLISNIILGMSAPAVKQGYYTDNKKTNYGFHISVRFFHSKRHRIEFTIRIYV